MDGSGHCNKGAVCQARGGAATPLLACRLSRSRLAFESRLRPFVCFIFIAEAAGVVGRGGAGVVVGMELSLSLRLGRPVSSLITGTMRSVGFERALAASAAAPIATEVSFFVFVNVARLASVAARLLLLCARRLAAVPKCCL